MLGSRRRPLATPARRRKVLSPRETKQQRDEEETKKKKSAVVVVATPNKQIILLTIIIIIVIIIMVFFFFFFVFLMTTTIPSSLGQEYLQTIAIARSYPHETSAFTQGLCFASDGLYESDGLYGHSRVRRVDVDSGTSVAETKLHDRQFGEGLSLVADGVLLQLTWREKVMIEWDLTLRKLRTLPQPFPGEGWGVTLDDTKGIVYFTDGSARLHAYRRSPVVSPRNKGGGQEEEIRYEKVREPRFVVDPKLQGARIEGLNELEMVNGELWANVYPMRHHKASNCIARIDPDTAAVKGWVDLNLLVTLQSRKVQTHRLNFVLNGIAFLPDEDENENDHQQQRNNTSAASSKKGRLFVTGKEWDFMYHVDVVPFATETNPVDFVRQRCGLHLPPPR
mmetsp:Transcript_5988/g.19464  ORF Transcript_5988/g.19464 Transcript_5988/m.19464 type:complete len:394 (-) Transcript_5988:587-1768(-)